MHDKGRQNYIFFQKLYTFIENGTDFQILSGHTREFSCRLSRSIWHVTFKHYGIIWLLCHITFVTMRNKKWCWPSAIGWQADPYPRTKYDGRLYFQFVGRKRGEGVPTGPARGWGTPARTGVPSPLPPPSSPLPWPRQRYASCGFSQEDFLVTGCLHEIKTMKLDLWRCSSWIYFQLCFTTVKFSRNLLFKSIKWVKNINQLTTTLVGIELGASHNALHMKPQVLLYLPLPGTITSLKNLQAPLVN